MTYLIAAVLASILLMADARADNFKSARYDAQRDQLVVQMVYRGTHPDHTFHLSWSRCRPLDQQPGMWQVAVDVLDDQWNDAATTEYSRTLRFDLSNQPCRPARVTLRTAPRFYYTLTIPADAGKPDGNLTIHAPSPPVCPAGMVHRGGSMCVPSEAQTDVVGEARRAQPGTLMSNLEPLNVKPGLEIAIFGKCGYQAQGEAPRGADSTAIHRPGCAVP
jgi:hypothetical protein